MKIVFFLILLTILSGCSFEQSADNEHKSKVGIVNNHDQFFYSALFAKRFEIKNGKEVKDWSDTFAIKIHSESRNGYQSCHFNLYLGEDVDFDYPQTSNFINIMGDRYDEIFGFAKNVPDQDAELHATLAFQSGNRISIEGFKNNELAASAGLNIDYVMNNAAKGINFIKTLGIPCDVLRSGDYAYFLRLKTQRGQNEHVTLNFPLPIKY